MGAQKVLIFGSISCGDWSFLQPYTTWPELVIAADGGMACAKAAGFIPTIYVGDSDSGGKAEAGMECIPLPAEKDWTDLQAAYELAVSRGAKDIIFTGCTGGRIITSLRCSCWKRQHGRAFVQGFWIHGTALSFCFPGHIVFGNRTIPIFR